MGPVPGAVSGLKSLRRNQVCQSSCRVIRKPSSRSNNGSDFSQDMVKSMTDATAPGNRRLIEVALSYCLAMNIKDP